MEERVELFYNSDKSNIGKIQGTSQIIAGWRSNNVKVQGRSNLIGLLHHKTEIVIAKIR